MGTHSPRHDRIDELLWFEDHKASTVRLPSEDMIETILFDLCQRAVQHHRKGRCDPAFASSDWGLRRIIRLVGIIMIIVNHKVTLVLIDSLSRFKMTRGLSLGGHGRSPWVSLSKIWLDEKWLTATIVMAIKVNKIKRIRFYWLFREKSYDTWEKGRLRGLYE